MYNSYNPEASLSLSYLNEILQNFKDFLRTDKTKKISNGSIRSYLSDVRHFLNWFLSFLTANQRLNHFPTVQSLLAEINPRILTAYKEAEETSHIPPKTINRRLSSLRRFGAFLQSLSWVDLNPFDTLRNISEDQPFPEADCHLEEFKAYLWQNQASQLTIKNYLADIRQFLTWSERQK